MHALECSTNEKISRARSYKDVQRFEKERREKERRKLDVQFQN